MKDCIGFQLATLYICLKCQASLACVLVSAPSLCPDPDNDSPNEAADDGMRIDALAGILGLA